MKNINYLEMIKKEVFNTLGCTDPVAIGLAVSTAYHKINGNIKDIFVRLDNNLYKNAYSVGIPGTNKQGIEYGIALALVTGRPEKKLLLFEDLKPEDIYKATELVKKNIITIVPDQKYKEIYIYAKVVTDIGKAEVKIKGAHDDIVEIKVNDEMFFEPEKNKPLLSKEMQIGKNLFSLTIPECIKIVEDFPINELKFLGKGVEKNIKAAEYQLSNNDCQNKINLTQAYQFLTNNKGSTNSLVTQAKKYVIAATEARMSGKKVSIVGCFGSGNHGITFFVTMGIVSKYLNVSKNKLLRAMGLGLLITLMIKQRTGLITPYCGCAVAISPALAAAITYLRNGDKEMIGNACNIVLSNIMGILCDGANIGCALKTGTSSGVAIESAFLALHGIKISSFDGFIGNNFKETLHNIYLLTNKEIKESTDCTMVSILKRKKMNINELF
ncbi:MAG: L-cysteine desulfidase family protein [Candidatus Helarchaeota archaeon]